MSVKKNMSYVYETELADILDVIHSEDFPIELYIEDEFKDKYFKNVRWNIPLIYNSKKVRNIDLGEGTLKIYLRHD